MNSQQRKIVVLGNEGVGKTSLVSNFLGLYDFSEEYKPTTTSDFFSKTVVHEEREISVSIWDIGGNAKIGRSFVRGTHGVMLVVDLAKGKRLLEGLDNKYEEVVKLAGAGSNDPFPCHVLANKSDLVTDANDLADAKELLDKWCARRSVRPIAYTIASAKSPEDVVVESSFTALLALTEEGNNNNNNNKSSLESAALNHSPQSYVDSNLDSTINFSKLLQADDDNMVVGKEETMVSPAASSPSSSNGPKVIEAKVVIAGAPAVGKTSILKRFTQNGDAINEENMGKYEPTLGADFRLVEVPARDKTLNMQVWDTAGDKKMIALGKSIYKNADYLILVYDMTSAQSFQVLDLYYNNFVLYGNAADPDAFPCLLVGNKCDIGERATALEDVLKWCAAKRPKRPITHIECSALRSIAVNDIFIIVADAIADYEDYLDGEGSDSCCSSTANRCFRDLDETGSQLSLNHHNMGQTPEAINLGGSKSCIAELKDEIAGGKFCTIV